MPRRTGRSHDARARLRRAPTGRLPPRCSGCSTTAGRDLEGQQAHDARPARAHRDARATPAPASSTSVDGQPDVADLIASILDRLKKQAAHDRNRARRTAGGGIGESTLNHEARASVHGGDAEYARGRLDVVGRVGDQQDDVMLPVGEEPRKLTGAAGGQALQGPRSRQRPRPRVTSTFPAPAGPGAPLAGSD